MVVARQPFFLFLINPIILISPISLISLISPITNN